MIWYSTFICSTFNFSVNIQKCKKQKNLFLTITIDSIGVRDFGKIQLNQEFNDMISEQDKILLVPELL